MSAINIHDVERQVENLYKLVALSPEGAAMTKSRLKATMEAGAAEAKRTQKTLITQQTRLMERSKKLLDGRLDGTIPGQLYREEQERINREMTAVSDRLGALQTGVRSPRTEPRRRHRPRRELLRGLPPRTRGTTPRSSPLPKRPTAPLRKEKRR